MLTGTFLTSKLYDKIIKTPSKSHETTYLRFAYNLDIVDLCGYLIFYALMTLMSMPFTVKAPNWYSLQLFHDFYDQDAQIFGDFQNQNTLFKNDLGDFI
jgi:hypothetical protein